MANEIERFAGVWFHKRKPMTLVLAGPSGTGKTFALRKLYAWTQAAASSVCESGGWEKPPDMAFAHWPEVTVAASQYELDCNVLNLATPELLVLDDIGADNDPWKKNAATLCLLLSKRQGRWNVISTNIAREAWEDRWDIRVADRLMRNAVTVEIPKECPSYTLI